MDNLKRILDYCESNIDLAEHQARMERQKKCLDFEELDRPCVYVPYPSKDFAWSPIEETHRDFAKMMYNELVPLVSTFEIHDSAIPMIRANYGIGTLPSVFGMESKIIDGNMPWVEHVGKEGAKKILAKGIPDYREGFGQRVLETYAFYKEMLSQYPKCNEVIKLYHPDYQGPFDIAHIIYGSEIYPDLYDEPELIHDLLALIVDTYLDGMKYLKPYIDIPADGYMYHWQYLYPGSIMLRNDSAVNVSKDLFREFVQPYDDMLLKAMGGGSVHMCGRADHWIFEQAKAENVSGYNFGRVSKFVMNQEYLDFLKPAFTDKKKSIGGFILTKEEVKSFDFKKYPTGVSFTVYVNDKEEALEVLDLCNAH